MDELRRAAEDWRTARERLEDEIRRASEAGESLRAIAAVVGLSHEHVRRIVNRI